MKLMTITESNNANLGPISSSKIMQSLEFKETTVSLYENEVPIFIDAELERLFENVYTSIARYKIYNEIENASTYVVRKGGEVTAVFLFRHEAMEVKVLNNQVKIDAEEIHRFTETIFARFKSVGLISFYAIETNISNLPYPFQQCNSLEEMVLTLPNTLENYRACLGSKMRYDVNHCTRNLERDFPSFRHEIFSKEDVSEQHIREIIRLTEARMAAKKKASYISTAETERIIRLVRIYGMVSIITIEGRVCGGQIYYRMGTRYFMQVIAHDPQYDDYKLGIICNYLTIRDCIASGGRECRFMGGGHAHKARFRAVPLDFDSVVVYRSRMQFFLDSRRILRTLFECYLCKLKRRILAAELKESFANRLLVKALMLLRNLKKIRLAYMAARK